MDRFHLLMLQETGISKEVMAGKAAIFMLLIALSSVFISMAITPLCVMNTAHPHVKTDMFLVTATLTLGIRIGRNTSVPLTLPVSLLYKAVRNPISAIQRLVTGGISIHGAK